MEVLHSIDFEFQNLFFINYVYLLFCYDPGVTLRCSYYIIPPSTNSIYGAC